MPMTAYCSAPLSPSSDSSVSVPLSFLPFRTRSFVHLICGRTPQVRSTASQAATAPSAVSGSIFSGASCGRSSAERYTPRPWAAGKAAAAPSAPRSLLVGHRHRAVRRALRGNALEIAVRGIHTLKAIERVPDYFRLAEAAAQLALAEHVRRIRQPVAQPRLRLDGVAVAPQGADRLPHRRAGDAELRGDVLAGDEVSRLRAEQRKNFLLTHRIARLLLIS